MTAREELAAVLDVHDVRTIVQHVANRLGANGGRWTLEFVLEDGSLVATSAKHGRIDREELERLGERDAPPLA